MGTIFLYSGKLSHFFSPKRQTSLGLSHQCSFLLYVSQLHLRPQTNTRGCFLSRNKAALRLQSQRRWSILYFRNLHRKFLHTSIRYSPHSVLTVALLEDAFVFSLQTFQKVSVVLFSLPDVKGALPPTLTVAFVYATPTIWRIKISSITHKTSPMLIDAELDFYLSISAQTHFGESPIGLRS